MSDFPAMDSSRQMLSHCQVLHAHLIAMKMSLCSGGIDVTLFLTLFSFALQHWLIGFMQNVFNRPSLLLNEVFCKRS